MKLIERRKGETDKQYAKRIEAMMNVVVENNRSLRKLIKECNSDVSLAVNKRTGKKYKEEARFMFTTLALVNKLLREGDAETCKTYVYETISELGFDVVEMMTDEYLKDNAYDHG